MKQRPGLAHFLKNNDGKGFFISFDVSIQLIDQ